MLWNSHGPLKYLRNYTYSVCIVVKKTRTMWKTSNIYATGGTRFEVNSTQSTGAPRRAFHIKEACKGKSDLQVACYTVHHAAPQSHSRSDERRSQAQHSALPCTSATDAYLAGRCYPSRWRCPRRCYRSRRWRMTHRLKPGDGNRWV